MKISSGVSAATFSMSMPPAALAMTTGRAGGAIEHEAEVQLPRNLEPFFDEHARDDAAFGPGLVRDEAHPEHLGGDALGLFGVRRELDAAALASPARVNLRLDDDGRRRDGARCRRPRRR